MTVGAADARHSVAGTPGLLRRNVQHVSSCRSCQGARLCSAAWRPRKLHAAPACAGCQPRTRQSWNTTGGRLEQGHRGLTHRRDGAQRGSRPAAAATGQEAAPGLAGILQAIQAQMQGQATGEEPAGADVEVQHLTYHPAGWRCSETHC